MTNPLEFWASEPGRHALSVGDVLRARDAEADDPYAVVSVVGIHRVGEAVEAIIAPFGTFGEAVSAPIEGQLLRLYEVLSPAEAEALKPAYSPAFTTDVDAAKAALAGAREEER